MLRNNDGSISDDSSGDKTPVITPAQRNKISRTGTLNSKRMEVNRSERNGEKKDISNKKEISPVNTVKSLSQTYYEKKSLENNPKVKEQQQQHEENLIMQQLQNSHSNCLSSVQEKSKGILYSNSMTSSWTPPRSILNKSESSFVALRCQFNVDVTGEDIPPMIPDFHHMRLPLCIIDTLHEMGITNPTPIQMQGLPAVLSGRDLIGISSTGSGKTFVFVLPLVLFALEEEMKLRVIEGEGPIGVILCPSRELATQTFNVINRFVTALSHDDYPQLHTVLCIGGESRTSQMNQFHKGIHIVVATPGRLNDFLHSGHINMHICKFLCLDEADRMLGDGFEKELQTLLSFMGRQRQTLLFSATFPKQFVAFARAALVRPITVNVGHTGAANVDVHQDVCFVREGEKPVFIIRECLNKTPPPVVIFSRDKKHVDDIEEYLLLKGVDVASIHGSKTQEERRDALQQFVEKKADVLIATDVASKGLDFPDVNHVINYDMPTDIETYIHRIGRTGRCGRRGMTTTLINESTPEYILHDLKHFLIESKQILPSWLMELKNADEMKYGEFSGGCAWCGGMGHRITNCPQLIVVDSTDHANADHLVQTSLEK